MFLLNNTRGRAHRTIYAKADGQSNAIFDISKKQLASAVNSDWRAMRPNDLVCVVQNTYNMSTVYRIDQITEESVNAEDGTQYVAFVVRGSVVAKFVDESHYTRFLSQFSINHPRLNNNKFCIGFNVANLDNQLDSARIKIDAGQSTIGKLKKIKN